MSRMDKEGDLRRDMAAMKGEMLQTVRQSGRRPRAWIGCLAIVVGGALVFFGAICWAVAATGLVPIPLFTAIAYHRPEPEHEVAATVPLDQDVSARLTSELTARLQAGGGTIKDRSISIPLSEGSFTASLRQAFADNIQTAFDGKRSQVAVDPDGLEMYLPLADNPRGTAVLLRLRVTAGQDGLSVRVSNLRIGSLPVPDLITQATVMPAIQQSFAGFVTQLSRYADITSVTYAPGTVTFSGTLAADVLKTK
jgi:hypothetical protein